MYFMIKILGNIDFISNTFKYTYGNFIKTKMIF